MFYRREAWERLIRGEIPNLVVLRPMDNLTLREQGDSFRIENPLDKTEMMRARQLYNMRRIGTEEELLSFLEKNNQRREVTDVVSQ